MKLHDRSKWLFGLVNWVRGKAHSHYEVTILVREIFFFFFLLAKCLQVVRVSHLYSFSFAKTVLWYALSLIPDEVRSTDGRAKCIAADCGCFPTRLHVRVVSLGTREAGGARCLGGVRAPQCDRSLSSARAAAGPVSRRGARRNRARSLGPDGAHAELFL